MTPVDAALLAQRAYIDAPTVGDAASASRMRVYGNVHAFRGTDDVHALLADIDFGTTMVWGLGRIYDGFYGALAAILPACLALPRPSVVVGHSLGAAMAIIYAAILAELGTIVSVYAFEPPRLCADDTMLRLLQAKGVGWFATRNGNDVVTQIPAGLSLPGSLQHIGHPLAAVPNTFDHGIDRVIEALQLSAPVAPGA